MRFSCSPTFYKVGLPYCRHLSEEIWIRLLREQMGIEDRTLDTNEELWKFYKGFNVTYRYGTTRPIQGSSELIDVFIDSIMKVFNREVD